jgi:hypothetical protein
MKRCPFVATCRRNLRPVVAVADGPHSRSCFPGHLQRQRMLARRSGSARAASSSAASLRFMQSPPFDCDEDATPDQLACNSLFVRQ